MKPVGIRCARELYYAGYPQEKASHWWTESGLPDIYRLNPYRLKAGKNRRVYAAPTPEEVKEWVKNSNTSITDSTFCLTKWLDDDDSTSHM